jgi:hypothetical protein
MTMKRLLIAMFLTGSVFSAAASAQKNMDPVKCASLAANGSEGRGRLDVAVFDHQAGQLMWPTPAKLEVPDEGVFVVVFKNTDSTKFDYSINSLNADASKTVALKADCEGVKVVKANQIVCVSWKHHEEFPLYRVTVTRRETAAASDEAARENLETTLEDKAAQMPQFKELLSQRLTDWKAAQGKGQEEIRALNDIETSVRGAIPISQSAPILEATEARKVAVAEKTVLFPYTFPVWVETTDAQLYYSTGLGFSTLVNDRFFIKTAADGKKTVERDRNGSDAFRPDLMAFATLTAPNKKSMRGAAGRLGLSVGLGIGEDSTPRYFIGPSLVLSHRMTISLGVIGAKVKRLPAGQKLHDAPINDDNTLADGELDSGFKVGAALSLSFKLGKDSKKFDDALNNPPQKIPETTPPAQ